MLRRRSIRMRIIVLVLVPVVALIALYGVALSLTLSGYLSLRHADDVREAVSYPVSVLQSQLTAERGLALEYLANPSHARLNALLEAEQDTEAASAAFLSVAASTQNEATAGERKASRTWVADLATLDALRTTVLNVNLSRASAAQAYSALIAAGDYVVTQALVPELTTSGSVQESDLLEMEQSLEAVTEERDVLAADLASNTTPPVFDTRLLTQLVAQHRDLWRTATGGLGPQYLKYFSTDIPAATATSLAGMEAQILSSPQNAMRVSASKWLFATTAYATGFRTALRNASAVLQASGDAQASSALLRLLLVGGLGLLAIACAITVAIVLSRALLKQLDELRLSALDLSSVRLPVVLARLRSGEEVDVEAETPRLDPGPSEIGQLGQAFNLAAQTAVAAAADEAEIRRGVNDVFRNLARRNQSLLTRQLELLDAMERRVTDPEELADLFRVDHLTTRMRRHAEGLLIVAGGSSGRVWRDPVPIVDVMRAAVAEVEDYTRIRVTSRSSSSVAGHAVADIIHMLAELVENATTFSPANTPVRIESDNVAKGLVVEIEDRGLGMTEAQIEEINTKLSDPPLLDLSGSEQLGLFIAGQLARRHDVRISVRGSAYGGIIAVVLIPTSLVVDAGYGQPLTVVGIRELGGRPVPQLPAPSGSTDGDMSEEPLTTAYLVDLETAATSVTTTAAHVGTGPFDQVGDGRTGDELVSADLVPEDVAPDDLMSTELSGGFVPAAEAGASAAQRVDARTVDAVTVDAEGADLASADSEPGGLKGAGPWLVEAGSAERSTVHAASPPGASDALSAPGRNPAPAEHGTGPESPKLILGPVTRFPGEMAADVIADPAGTSADTSESTPAWAADPGTGTGPKARTAAPDQDSDAGVTPIWSRLTAAGPPWPAPGAQVPTMDIAQADRSVGWPTRPSADEAGDSVGGSVGWPDRAPASSDRLNLASGPPDDYTREPRSDESAERASPGRESPLPEVAAGPTNGSASSQDVPVATGTIPLLPKRHARTADRSFGRAPAGADLYPSTAGDQPTSADIDGLPVRVPQASLAPQLRDQPTAERTQEDGAAPSTRDDQESSGPEPSPDAARSLMSALQQGWERGRSTAEQMTDEPDGTQQ